ncbi:hypothetical protein A7M79_00940 [Acinetobacter baumannii]|uniref:DUF2726 domain-containing protein n=1 Tax=Acinetobacter baumannii TaxID=470 RepID=UPI0008DCC2EB|nr:hypothetical protein A7M79_00940 [Acinetobacter baumannii]
MKFLFLIIAFIALGLLLFLCRTNEKKIESKYKKNKQVDSLIGNVQPTRVLGEFEIEMYKLLLKSCPDHIVLCQVSFNAFIKCSDVSIRNKFNRSMCDFMIVDRDFTPILCIELDDRSHTSPKVVERDCFRDNLLSAAYIPTVRFPELPLSVSEVKREINPFLYEKNLKVFERL